MNKCTINKGEKINTLNATGQNSECHHVHLRKHFRKYHRFFLFSPFFWLVLSFYLFYKQGTGGKSFDGYSIALLILGFIVLKEIFSFTIARKIYRKVLEPVDILKDAVEEVAAGNYDIQVSCKGANEITSLFESFNTMTKRLKESEELKIKYEMNRKELIANISHDLKTPITSINGYIDGIVDGVANSPEKLDKYMCIIQQNSRYMNQLIDDLNLYSKLDFKKFEFNFQSVNYVNYIEDLYNEVKLEMDEQKVKVNLAINTVNQVNIDIDGQHIARAIRNIIANSLKYNDKAIARVEFELVEEQGTIKLCISDNGPGIPQDKLNHIFDRFYRADEARNSTIGGSGLGLAITKEIINAHNGDITAISKNGEGTTICIEFKIESKGE